MNLKDNSVLVYDNSGFFTGFASCLTDHFGNVGYFYPWETFYSDGRELVVGQGLPGITRVKFLERNMDQWDLIVFTCAQDGYYQEQLRKYGKRVFGSGLGSEVELLRWKTKQRFIESGIELPECHRVSGVDELRQFFKDNPRDQKWYVKVSELRGLADTWGARNYAEAKTQIDEWECKYSPQCYLMHFLVELAIEDADEIGYDGLSIDGEFPETCMWGAEKKDKSYFGTVSDYSSLPEPLRKVNESISPVLKELQYRNFIASELRNKSPIDITARCSSPAGEVVTSNMENIGEVLWFGAEGQLVQPIWKHKHGAQLIITSDSAMTSSLVVDFPEEIRPFVKLYNHARVNAGQGIGVKDQFVPQVNRGIHVGSVIALSDDPQEAIDLCKERAGMIKGFELEFECDSLDQAAEEMNVSSSQLP